MERRQSGTYSYVYVNLADGTSGNPTTGASILGVNSGSFYYVFMSNATYTKFQNVMSLNVNGTARTLTQTFGDYAYNNTKLGDDKNLVLQIGKDGTEYLFKLTFKYVKGFSNTVKFSDTEAEKPKITTLS